jgi:transposase
MRPRGSPAELERRRFRAVELLAKGEPREVVARILGVDPGTLSRWLRLAKEGNLKAKPAPGRPREMSVEDCKQLEALLLQGATAHGWTNDLWTGKRVQQVIQRQFNVTYNPDYVCHILKVYLNWTSQQPEHHPRGDDPDNAEILRWTQEEFPRILREADARGASLAFVDEAGFLLEPTARRTFAPRGRSKRSQTSMARSPQLAPSSLAPGATALISHTINCRTTRTSMGHQSRHSSVASIRPSTGR